MLLSDVKMLSSTQNASLFVANVFRGSLKCSRQQQETVGGRLITFPHTTIFVIIKSNKTGNVRMT